MNKTNIEYVDDTWNPVTGCTPISDGCKNCWAERMAKGRLKGRFGYDADDPFKVTLHPSRLDEPLRRKKPCRIAVSFMGDLFHKDVPDEFIERVFEVMAKAQQHDFYILTKRPERMDSIGEWLLDVPPDVPPLGACLKNVKFGISIETQQALDDRLSDYEASDKIFGTPTSNFPDLYEPTLWLSVEPMLGPITLDDWSLNNIGWVVIGAESGPGARPCKIEWIRDLANQCKAAGIPYYIKQMETGCIFPEARMWVTSDIDQFPEDLRHREVV